MAPGKPDSHSFTSLILDRLIADNQGDQAWADLVLGACDGPEALNAALEGDTAGRPARQSAQQENNDGPEPPGAYLRSITVEGFRGIGPAATLTLTPGPGLTLVVGRNGSGKSSFAEGLEVLLTGGNKRWDGRSAVWKDGWRCLHQPNPCAVRAEFAVEALGTVTVERRWEETSTLDASTAWFQSKGAPRQPYEQLGWHTAIRTHRPLLPYSELGALFDRPSEIHDALVEVLGLGEFDAIQKTLQNARKARETIVSSAGGRLAGILPRLRALAESSGDKRAAAAAKALAGKKPDLESLRQALEDEGQGSVDADLTALKQAAMQAQAPSREAVSAATNELREAAAAVEASRGTDAGRARALAHLLEQALRFHAAHTTPDCPVCGTSGALGGTWRDDTKTALADLKSKADAADRAHKRLEQAIASAQGLLRTPSTHFESVGPLGIASAAPALVAVAEWSGGASITDPLALAAHLETQVDGVATALDTFRAEVHAELSRREDLWRPMATELRDWVPQALAAGDAQAQVADLKKAETWFKGVQADMRAERFRPIADRAKAIWRQLRQQSNVELEDVTLKGAATQRSVALDVTVDGVPGAALGVMSQGELNALALSLFMPRASLPESPFRFMVIDDPVQSMDPSRVDGLARALREAARTRQVVVFTHDERLPDAVRHLLIPATVIEVTRRPGSVVETRVLEAPVKRYFDDAMTIVRTEKLPTDVQRRIVPAFCRSGVEAACADALRRRRLKAGARHADIEADLEHADTLRQRLALALLGDVTKAGEVGRTLENKWNGSDAVVRALNEGSHGEYDGELQSLVRNAERLAAQIGALS
jgi:recombinational DNA repair ATPase RecF